jgi:hypothetical protein
MGSYGTYTPPTFPATIPSGANGMTALVSLLKEIYVGQKVQTLAYQKRPFLGMVAKEENFIGKLFPLPIVYDDQANSSNTFSYSQTNTSPVLTAEFMLQRAKIYNTSQIDGETIRAASADLGAFARATTTVMDNGFTSAANMASAQLFRGGTGSIGQVGAIAAGVITLSDPNSAVNFGVNQVLQFTFTDGGVPTAAVGYVISVNRLGGVITVSTSSGGAAASPALWAAGGYLLTQGNNNLALQGLGSWLVNPALISPVDNFFGVNRSVDTRLSGCYFNGSSESIEEALVDAASITAREGGVPDVAFMNYASFTYLVKSLGSKAQFVQEISAQSGSGQEVEVFYAGVTINGPAGPITVIPDRSCPSQTAFLLQMDSWKLYSAGPAIDILDHEGKGLDMLRINNADAVELRLGGYMQLGCNAPVRNCLVSLIA